MLKSKFIPHCMTSLAELLIEVEAELLAQTDRQGENSPHVAHLFTVVMH